MNGRWRDDGDRRDCRAPRGSHLTAPAITPDTNCRWNAKNTASGITIERNAPGASTSMLLPNCRTCCLERDRDRLAAGVGEDQRDQHVVPHPQELEDAQRGDRRAAQRHHDPGEQPQLARPVQPGRLQQFARDLREEVPQQEHRERQPEARVEEDHPGDRRRRGPILPNSSATGISATCTGTTSSADDDQEPPVPAGEVHPREGVAGQRADDDDQDRRRDGDQHGVQQRAGDRRRSSSSCR